MNFQQGGVTSTANLNTAETKVQHNPKVKVLHADTVYSESDVWRWLPGYGVHLAVS